MASTNLSQTSHSLPSQPDSFVFDSSSYFLSLPFSNELVRDSFGGPVVVNRSLSSTDSETIIFDVSFGPFSLEFACLSSSELLSSNLLCQRLVGFGSRFQKTNRFTISSLTDLAHLSGYFDPVDFSDCLDQVDYLLALFFQDLFASLDLNSSVPFIHLKSFLHEFLYQEQADIFLNSFYDYYF